MGRRRDAARQACRHLAELARELAELAREVFARPTPMHWPYIRCDRCGRVGPRLSLALSVSFRRVGDTVTAEETPPETVCRLCRYTQPRALGDELPGTVEVTCAFRWGLRGGWRRCATTHPVPADAALVVCPACGTLTAGPAAESSTTGGG